jgi:carboxymethylenebutenolidase
LLASTGAQHEQHFVNANQRNCRFMLGLAQQLGDPALSASGIAVAEVIRRSPVMSIEMAALQYLQALPYVHKNRTAVMGFSFGGIQTMLAVERGPGYRVAVNCSGAAESWRGSSFLRSRLTTAASNAKMPVFFLQAENDHDLTPNRILSEEVRKAGKPVETKIYPAFGSGPREGHSFCVRGTETWFPDVLRFIETYLQ